MQDKKVRQLAAVMFADIVGYTSMMQEDENLASQVRVHHRKVFETLHDQFHGEIIQYYGDGTLSVFKSAVEAVRCAVNIQKELRQNDPVIPIRIGLHMGDIVYSETDVYGDGVNLASRIESMGVTGAILLSSKLNGELKNHPEITTESLGLFELKNVETPVEIFSVVDESLVVPKRSEVKGKQSETAKSIAVLPFVNMSTDPENEFFSDGMTEEIINALTKVKGLRVTSRTSSFHFKKKNIPIPEIGKSLNVSAILEGSIRLSGNQMRITAQLIDVENDYHFWSETFDRSMDNIFDVQDEISLLIADKLREHLGHFEIQDHLVEIPDIPVDAYKTYLKSRYLILQMGQSDIEKGITDLVALIKDHPGFVHAYLGIHLGYTMMGTIGYIPAKEAFMKSKPYLEKAIEIDPELPECQLHLSWISFLEDWDLEGTYRHLNKAMESYPIVDFYQSMASTLVAEGKFKAAMNYIDTAFQLDPFSPINFHLKGFIHFVQEEYNEAMPFFRESIKLNPNSQVSLPYIGQVLILTDRADEALAYFEGLDTDVDPLMKKGGIALSYAALENPAEAEMGIIQLEKALETDAMERALNLLIQCRTMMGQYDEAISLIKKGFEYRLPLVVYMGVEPMLKPLRSDQRFVDLMRTVLGDKSGFQEKERKYKKSLLDQNEMDEYRESLLNLMQEDRPYTDPNLTLRGLAELMDLPANRLSQLLNEGFDQNFSEFVNSYRLDLFKSKAADPRNAHLTILAMAYDSGFNSKTVFNTYFKKRMGMTPRAYLTSNKDQVQKK